MATAKTSAKAWTPNFDGDGQTLVGWAHTGVAQIIDLKNSHKRIPSNWYSNDRWEGCVP